MKKKTFYGTFGRGHPFEKYYQPIMAESLEEARSAMFYVFSSKWAFVYDNLSSANLQVSDKPLPPLIADDCR